MAKPNSGLRRMINGLQYYARIMEKNCVNRETCENCPMHGDALEDCAKYYMENILNILKDNERKLIDGKKS